MKERVKITGEVCDYCGNGSFLCDCCEGCTFPYSEHCQICDSCECHGCAKEGESMNANEMFERMNDDGMFVTGFEPVPVQLAMDTEMIMCRTVNAYRRTGKLNRLSATDTIKTVVSKMTVGETVAFEISNPYRDTGVLRVSYESADAPKFEISPDLRGMLA